MSAPALQRSAGSPRFRFSRQNVDTLNVLTGSIRTLAIETPADEFEIFPGQGRCQALSVEQTHTLQRFAGRFSKAAARNRAGIAAQFVGTEVAQTKVGGRP